MLFTENKQLYNCGSFVITIDNNHTITVAIAENHVVTLDDVKIIHEVVGKQTSTLDDCTLLTYGGKFTSIEPEAREYAQKRIFNVNAQAYIVHSLAQRIIMKFLVRLRASKMAIKIFESEDQAKVWLLKHRKAVKVA